MKAIDIWMALTLTFVFASLIEFAIVNVIMRKERAQELRKKAIQAAKRVSMNDKMKKMFKTRGRRSEWGEGRFEREMGYETCSCTFIFVR